MSPSETSEDKSHAALAAIAKLLSDLIEAQRIVEANAQLRHVDVVRLADSALRSEELLGLTRALANLQETVLRIGAASETLARLAERPTPVRWRIVVAVSAVAVAIVFLGVAAWMR